MSAAALLAAALLVPGGPPAAIDFGPVQLGGSATHVLSVPALGVTASGAGFSATRTHGGVLIVFEPYELHERATGTHAPWLEFDIVGPPFVVVGRGVK